MSAELQDTRNLRIRRCGVCLFRLPGPLATVVGNDPPNGGITTFENGHDAVTKRWIGRPSGLWASVSRGCDVCAAIASIVGLSRDKHPDPDIDWGRGYLSISSAVHTKYWISVELERSETEGAQDLRDIHPYLRVGTLPSRDTSSAQAFDMLKTRMRTCLSHHKQCPAPCNPRAMPKRLLYIDDSESSTVRLIDDTSDMAPEPYVCLSHRWTEQTASSSLTSDRIMTYKVQIPKTFLYPLLRDAFVAAERLGFRSIWIDCLCICQDDLNDWNEQAAEMSAIYENAVVTISALDAQLNDWQLFCKDPQEKTHKLCSRGGRTIMLTETNISHPFFVDTSGAKNRASSVSEKYPLLKRGWVYQERLLARRIAHFTRSEVIWECKEAMSCECGHNEDAWAMVKDQSPRLSDMVWAGICAEYAKTELSIDTDKLPALSGVARRFGEAHGWTYLAGVWREDPDLTILLLWFNSTSHTRQYIPGLPSWSWASARAATFHPVFQRWGLVFRVVDYELIPGPVPYSTPKSIQLVVEGPCSSITVKFNPGSFENGILTFPGDGTEYNCFMDYMHDEETKSGIEQNNGLIFFLCIWDYDGCCGLLLKPTGLRESTYERIAFFSGRDAMEHGLWESRRITLV